jgi:hypothetical protein
MSTEQLERDVVDRPIVNSWRVAPTEKQKTFAASLCRSELPYAERVRTIASLDVLDFAAVSALIDELTGVRERRMRRLRREVHGKRR